MELCSPSRMRKLFDTIPARIENSSASDARVFKDSIRILRGFTVFFFVFDSSALGIFRLARTFCFSSSLLSP